jgi:hypothetical protein
MMYTMGLSATRSGSEVGSILFIINVRILRIRRKQTDEPKNK